jgi:3-oxoacyl-ACP reductase-like protein
MKDSRGNELNNGDKIAYATTRFRDVVILVGTILSIAPNGTVFVRWDGLPDGDLSFAGALEERGVKLNTTY